MNNGKRICGTEDQSLLTGFCWTEGAGEQSAGWPTIWKNARRVETYSRNFRSASFKSVLAMPLSERRAWVFDLAANFLYSIVIPVDLMTFQTRDISNTSKKLAGVLLVALKMPCACFVRCRYRQASLSLWESDM
jgi:hypothetical protein